MIAVLVALAVVAAGAVGLAWWALLEVVTAKDQVRFAREDSEMSVTYALTEVARAGAVQLGVANLVRLAYLDAMAASGPDSPETDRLRLLAAAVAERQQLDAPGRHRETMS